MTESRSFAVVGAGISGLAAAWELSRHGAVTVYDPAPPGGKLQTETFEGRRVDIGPDAFLTRVPEAIDLCAELGMTEELVAPTTGAAMLWTDAGLQPMPSGLVLGAPKDLRGIARSKLISPLGVARAALDLVLPARRTDQDVSVYDLVAGRFGHQVASRLVDPLVGGIHAGRTEELSARATVPQLFEAAQRSQSLLRALGRTTAPTTGAMFLTPLDGLGRLVDRLVERLTSRGVTFRLSPVTTLEPRSDHHVVVHPDDEVHDGVVLAIPSRQAASAMGPWAPRGLEEIPTASVALVLMSFAADEVTPPPGISGFLVPRPTGRLMTACSFASTKWPHWAAPDRTLLRLSAGRAGDRRAEVMADDELVDRLALEVHQALGVSSSPTGVRVTRWPEAFPQYVVGHLERVAHIEADLARRGGMVAVAGASYRGAGIPACIRSGRRAAEVLMDAPHLLARAQP